MKKTPEKFDIDLDMDIASAEVISETNEKLVKYLQDSGDNFAAERVEDLIKNQKKDEKIVGNKNPVYEKLLITNTEILKTLKKIYTDLYDEQDTSIHNVVNQITNDESTSQNVQSGKSQTIQPLIAPTKPSTDENTSSSFFPMGAAYGAKKILQKAFTRSAAGTATKAAATAETKMATRASTKAAAAGEAGLVKTAAKAGKYAKFGKLLRLSKAAGPVGAIITAGLTAYDAYQGWNNTEENLGIDQDKATITNKASSAAGGVISGLTFGLVNEKNVSQGINNFVGGNQTIKYYEDAGIIKYHTFGTSEVLDWGKLAALPAQEIQNIINIDDWTKQDLDKMVNIRDASAARTGAIPPPKINAPPTPPPTPPAAAQPQKGNPKAKIAAAAAATAGGFAISAGEEPPARVQPSKKKEPVNTQVKDAQKQQANNAEKNINDINKNIAKKQKQLKKAEESGDVETANKLKENINNLEQQKNTQQEHIQTYNETQKVQQETNETPVQKGNKRGSGIKKEEPKKVSENAVPTEQNVETKNEKPQQANESVETSKTKKEVVVDNSNKNLTQQTQAYDTNKSTAAVQSIAPLIKSNINKPEDQSLQVPGKDRILNLFS